MVGAPPHPCSPHTHSTAFSLSGDQGPEEPLGCRHGTHELCEGPKARATHRYQSLAQVPRCLPTRKTGCASLSHRQTTDCPLPTPDPSPGCNLISSFLPFDAQRPALGLGRIPPWGWKNRSGTRALARRFGQGPRQGRGDSYQNSLLPENFIPLPGHWHGDEGRIIPGR